MITPIIRMLNERGVVPDLVTYGPRDAGRMVSAVSTTALRFRVVRLRRVPLAAGDLLEELILPYSARRHLRAYDAVIASCTAIYGFSPTLPVLRLICFPLERVPDFEARYESSAFRVYGHLARFLYRLAATRTSYHGIWVAISRFTRTVALETYPIAPAAIHVVYPPAAAGPEGSALGQRERLVVSVGGFHPDKRQLEQIAIARAVPDARFAIVGSSRSSRYLDRCSRAAANVPNVILMPDASPSAVTDILSRAKVFLHTKENEHFGISTVEAILHGCIPVVHDSGGQQEIVADPELRFKDDLDAIRVLRLALLGAFDQRLPTLRAHAAAFTESSFVANMAPLLDELLGAI